MTETQMNHLIAQLQGMFAAKTWDETRAYLQSHPDLLTDDALQLFRHLIEQAPQDDPHYKSLVDHYNFIVEYRNISTTKEAQPDALKLAVKILTDALAGQSITLAPDQLTTELVTTMQKLATANTGQVADMAQHLAQALQQALTPDAPHGGQTPSPAVGEGRGKGQTPSPVAGEGRGGGQTPSPVAGEGRGGGEGHFLMQALQTVAESNGNPSVVYPFFDAHLPQLTLTLAQTLQTWATATLTNPATPPDQAQFIANTIGNFSNLIQEYPRGNRAAHLEIALAGYQAILALFTPTAFPQQWATVQNNLAIAYSDRIRGDRADNLELAIQHYTQALSVRTQTAFPQQWADTQNNLASAYSDRIRGDRADNLELAIQHYTQALSIYTQTAFPQQWAMTQNNLAIAYRNRIRGDRADNLELAIQHYTQALSVRTQTAFPQQWAMTQNNLGLAYWDVAQLPDAGVQIFRFDSDKSEDLDSRVAGRRARAVELALTALRHALTVRTPTAFPQDCRDTAYALGWRLYTLGRYQAAHAALETAHQAVERLRQEMKQHESKERLAAENADLYARLVHCDLLLASDPHPSPLPEGEGVEFPPSPSGRGDGGEGAEFPPSPSGRGDGGEGVEFPPSPREREDGGEGVEFPPSPSGRGDGGEGVEFHPSPNGRGDGGEGVSQEEYLRQAFNHALAGKGRAFIDRLATLRPDLSQLADPALQQDLHHIQQLRQEIDTLFTQLLTPPITPPESGGAGGGSPESQEDSPESGEGSPESGEDSPESGEGSPESQEDNPDSGKGDDTQYRARYEQLQTRQRQESQLWRDLAYKYPAYFTTTTTPALTTTEATHLAAQLQATLVEYVRHAGGWSAFVFHPNGQFQHVSLTGITELFSDRLASWLARIDQFDHDRATQRAEFMVNGFLDLAYTFHNWYQVLLQPLNLPPRGRLIIAPADWLNLLPFSLIQTTPPLDHRQNYNPAPYLYEQYELSFTPTLARLKIALTTASAPPATPTCLTVAYPGTGAHYLPNAVPEAETIAQYYHPHTTPLHTHEATPTAVLTTAQGQTIVHFSCHGLFDSQHPDQSGLALHEGQLSIAQVIGQLRLQGTHLTCLSACQTNRMALRGGEEHVGLVQSFMAAGTQAVIASLWSVPDESTRLLFEAFYSGLRQGQPAPLTLRAAMTHIRHLPGRAHPYYWAAFQLNGAV